MKEPHHRHKERYNSGYEEPGDSDDIFEENVSPGEESALLLDRHMSMEHDQQQSQHRFRYEKIFYLLMCLIPVAIIVMSGIFPISSSSTTTTPSPIKTYNPLPIEDAQEYMLDIGDGLSLWYRIWGNQQSGIPVLFVHGGPGNAIEDYHNGNKKFFDYEKFFVIEIDQRGTGRSQPSVRDDWRNMKYYKDISIDKMSTDFEKIRKELGIDRWLVFGGSWGSTLSLDYAMRFPQHCIAIIVRGIFLNSKSEFADVYFRKSHEDSKRELEHFYKWYKVAAQDAAMFGESELDPNDESGRILRIYERMIQRGDPKAIWRWMVFEYNLMEEDQSKHLNPNKIDEHVMPEAQSVAFFEARLYNHGTFEEPVNLLERVNSLKGIHTWVCQGSRDKVCPPQYAHNLVDTFKASNVEYTARFINSGHESTDPVMEKCLQDSVRDFLEAYM